ncbi:hypothetical protein COB64_04205 [Candidatus Wolfebacteria bacterium]|nr:MAG: hypothetical protein COB64_04205 [Candidatus Wolfebacteria bacterium]
MDNDDNKITYFAETDFRNEKKRFGIRGIDRTKHIYVIGKTGMGKSVLLENMAIQDIQNGEGMAFIDPHGGSAEKLLDYVPQERIKDVIYFAPFDIDYPISFNIMEDVGFDKRHLVVSGLISSFKKIWIDAWSSRMEHILTNTLLALLEYPDSTLLGVNRMYVDKAYRKKVVENITDPTVKSFWVDEFAKYTDRFAAEATPAIQNKIGQFTTNPIIRNIIGQPKSSFDIRDIMDNKKILIMNLSKGRVGEQNASLLGGMLITKVYLAAMSRADETAEALAALPNFYFHVDEFQSFANETFADILAEARKYKLNLTIAHQYIAQMEDAVRDAVFGNVGTTITFRVGPFDAEVLEKVFVPTFTQDDIVSLGRFQIYLSLMVDGIGSTPFSAKTLPPIELTEESHKEEVIKNSRTIFASRRSEVEEKITSWINKSFEEPRAPRKTATTSTSTTASTTAATTARTVKRVIEKKPPVSRVKKAPPPRAKPAPVKRVIKSSPKLKMILDKLESEERPSIKTEEEKKPVAPPVKSMSLSELQKKSSTVQKKKSTKDASSETMSALKSVLNKALSDKDSTANEEKQSTHSTPPKKNIKEVPEDVLRSILE